MDPSAVPSPVNQLPVYPATRPNEGINEDLIKQAESALQAMQDYSEDRDNDNVFSRLVIEEPAEFRGEHLDQSSLQILKLNVLLEKLVS